MKFDVTVFRRVEVEYLENQRNTIARYHVQQQSEAVSSTSSLDDEQELQVSESP